MDFKGFYRGEKIPLNHKPGKYFAKQQSGDDM